MSKRFTENVTGPWTSHPDLLLLLVKASHSKTDQVLFCLIDKDCPIKPNET